MAETSLGKPHNRGHDADYLEVSMFRFLSVFLILLLLSIPGNAAFADGGVVVGEQTPLDEFIQYGIDIAVLILLGVAAALCVVVGLAVARIILTGAKSASNWFIRLDKRLEAFGQTPVGKAVHSGVSSISQQLDQPTDALVIQSTAALNAMQAQVWKVFHTILPQKPEALTEQDVISAAQVLVAGLRELVNGKALPNMTPEQFVAQLYQQVQRPA